MSKNLIQHDKIYKSKFHITDFSQCDESHLIIMLEGQSIVVVDHFAMNVVYQVDKMATDI